jgi:FixJ family two-component response regulator
MARRKRQLLVAIVDDDARVRVAIGDLLDSNGLRARGFGSAEAFLGSRYCESVGCLILDVRLPGMSGLELQRELQARGLSIPVIFATSAPDITNTARASAVAVLPKPFDPAELVRLVRATLQRP